MLQSHNLFWQKTNFTRFHAYILEKLQIVFTQTLVSLLNDFLVSHKFITSKCICHLCKRIGPTIFFFKYLSRSPKENLTELIFFSSSSVQTRSPLECKEYINRKILSMLWIDLGIIPAWAREISMLKSQKCIFVTNLNWEFIYDTLWLVILCWSNLNSNLYMDSVKIYFKN